MHRFPCRKCGEEVGVGLDVDYVNIGWRVVFGENAEPCEEQAGAPIVNLDANFLVPASLEGVDKVFPRLEQMHDIATAITAARDARGLSRWPDAAQAEQLRSRSDYAAEWKLLRAVWSLHRNGQDELSRARLTTASTTYYSDPPLDDLADWLFRFATKLTQPALFQLFEDALAATRPALEQPSLARFASYYQSKMSQQRGTKYFNLIKEYFAAYDEFGQVQFTVVAGLELSEDLRAGSAGFDATRMFYGNAFEAFASLVEVLACINNVLAGREFDAFVELSLDKYQKLDKAARFEAFASNPAFTRMCAEADNQLRNASHHGSIAFDPATRLIHFRSGKGGTGPEQQISYTAYLQRCVRIFMQTMALLGFELVLCNRLRIRPPL